MRCNWWQKEKKIGIFLTFWDCSPVLLKSVAFDFTVPMTGSIIGLYSFIRMLSN